MVTRDERSRDGASCAEIDRGVEEQVDTLHCESRRFDNYFAGWQGLLAKLAVILLCDHGRDVGLDTTCTETHDNDRDDKEAERSARLCDDLRSSGGNQDDVTDTGMRH